MTTSITKDQAYWNGVSIGRAQCPCTPTEPTYQALTEWIERKWPVSSVHINESGEVIIHTGLTVEMNGELLPIGDLEEE